MRKIQVGQFRRSHSTFTTITEQEDVAWTGGAREVKGKLFRKHAPQDEITLWKAELGEIRKNKGAPIAI